MATTWEVTGDQPDQYSSDGSGTPVTGHLITFRTGAGATGSVFVPDTQYNATVVRRLVTAKAVVADEIRALTSES